jgi:hypothetical protein
VYKSFRLAGSFEKDGVFPEKGRPLKADYSKYSDIDTDADDEVFEEDWEAEHVRALEDELYTRHGDEIEAKRTRQRLADEAQVSCFLFCARATSTPDREFGTATASCDRTGSIGSGGNFAKNSLCALSDSSRRRARQDAELLLRHHQTSIRRRSNAVGRKASRTG